MTNYTIIETLRNASANLERAKGSPILIQLATDQLRDALAALELGNDLECIIVKDGKHGQ